MTDRERAHTRKLLDELARHSGIALESFLSGAHQARQDDDCAICAEIQAWARDRIDQRAYNHPTDPHT